MKRLLQVALFCFALSIGARGQLVGTCAPIASRPAENLSRIRGVLVDQNLAVIPNVKVSLQRSDGGTLGDLASVNTDQAGRFDLGHRPAGLYRLTFAAPPGFCRPSVPIRSTRRGWKGMRVTVPVAASDTCPQYCEDRLKVEETE